MILHKIIYFFHTFPIPTALGYLQIHIIEKNENKAKPTTAEAAKFNE